MRRTEFLLFSGVLVLAATVLQLVNGQIQPRNTVPDTITQCYMNTTAYNRFTRLPMHIDNLIAIIRKIETKTNGQWSARQIARTLIHRYMFDGMEYKPDAKQEFVFGQKPEEAAKSQLIKDLIPIPVEEIFPDILDNDEKCSLHWMLSHSMNATMRDDELNPGSGGYNPNPGSGGYNPNPGFGSGYPNGNNPIGGNNPYNPNTNNGGYPNQNPPFGSSGSSSGNQWRGKRDVSNVASDSNWNLSKEAGSQAENQDYDGTGTSSQEHDDYDSKEQSEKPKKDELHLPDDSDVEALVDVTPESLSKSGRQMAAPQKTWKKTRRPVETGVVFTKWGNIAAGRVIAGIAAGLEPSMMSVSGGTVYKQEPSYGGTGNNNYGGSGYGSNNPFGSGPSKSVGGQPQYPSQQQPSYPGQQPQYPGMQPQPQYPSQQQPPYAPQYAGRRKRQIPSQNLSPLESLYAATLAGDAGQAAIMNGKNEMGSAIVPAGRFNDSVCPREYILNEHSDPTKEVYRDSNAWTYLTEAEIRGGVDGIILGSNIRRWDPSYTLRLSDILNQYYSEDGIAGESQFRSCDRSSLLGSSLDGQKIREQTRSFAYVYNNKTLEVSGDLIVTNPNIFERIVNEANDIMYRTASSLGQMDPPCVRRPPGSGSDAGNDNQKYVIPRLTVYGVMDHTASYYEIDQQKRFLGELAYELKVSPSGSRLGVVDGNSGTVVISPNWTDVSSVLACNVMSIPIQTKQQDYTRVMNNMRSELEKVKNDELRYNYTNQNGIVILFLVQGKRIEDNQRNDIIRIANEINKDVYGGVSVVAASTKYQESDFQGIRFIKVQQTGQNFSDFADEFAQSLIRNTHGALRYPYCNGLIYNQENEHQIGTNLFIFPETIEYLKISPEYFFSSRSLVLRFTSDNGRVRVCASRKEWYPNQSNEGNANVECRETSGNYIVPGKNDVDAEFRDSFFHKPCGKSGKLEGCDPIYISITPISYTSPGQVGMDCSVEGCQSSNQVKVTFTHWDMRCNGAMRTLLSSTIAIITTAIALLNWMKT